MIQVVQHFGYQVPLKCKEERRQKLCSSQRSFKVSANLKLYGNNPRALGVCCDACRRGSSVQKQKSPCEIKKFNFSPFRLHPRSCCHLLRDMLKQWQKHLSLYFYIKITFSMSHFSRHIKPSCASQFQLIMFWHPAVSLQHLAQFSRT